jgi:hypothetical protein
MERKPSRFELRLPPVLEDRIDNWRRELPDLPPRAEAARRLIERGLDVSVEDIIQDCKDRGRPDIADIAHELLTAMRKARSR